jgi:hypothetical protein
VPLYDKEKKVFISEMLYTPASGARELNMS